MTGANSGIGFEISRALSRQGASVTMACRNPQKCFVAVDKIRNEAGYSGAPLRPLIMDVSDLSSVQKAVGAYLMDRKKPLDMLFLNAGIFSTEHDTTAKIPTSKDGIEKVFATNVVGHHLLYRLLEPTLQNSTMARVVVTSSVASINWLPPYALPWRFGDTSPLIPATLKELNAVVSPSLLRPYALYGRSKLAQVAWVKALTRRLGKESTIYVNSAHPGVVQTNMINAYESKMKGEMPSFLPSFLIDMHLYLLNLINWSANEGALTELYLGVATDEIQRNNVRGRYFHPQSVEVSHPYADDEELQESVWTLCEEVVAKNMQPGKH